MKIYASTTVKRSVYSFLFVIIFVVTGCSSMTTSQDDSQPTANEVFHNLYTTITLATSANGNETKFRWKNNTQPFPHQEASWADVTVFPCDNDQGQLKLMAGTTYDLNLHNENYQQQIENVRTTWEAHGLTVRNVGASKGMMQIATDLDDGSTVVYTAGIGGESIEADTICLAEFKGDPSTAQTYPAAKAG